MAKDETPKDPTAAALDRLATIAEAQMEAAKSQAIISEATAKRLKPKSLEVSEIAQVSAFNPRGEKDFPMPKLKCDVLAPWKIDKHFHGCTREEVELLNLLVPGEYRMELNDETPARVQVVAKINDATGAIEELILQPNPPWNNEHKGRFKSLTVMLREMFDSVGIDHTHVLTMKAEKAEIASGRLSVSVSA